MKKRNTLIDHELEIYLAEHFEKTPDLLPPDSPARPSFFSAGLLSRGKPRAFAPGVAGIPDIDKLLRKLESPFSETLFRLIDRSGKTDAEIYKRANIDRRLFSKIRNKKHYTPSKQTVLALAVALELPLDDALGLLACAGYTLSHNSKFDVIVEYFILNGKYDVYQINEALYQYDQPLLGGRG